MIHSTIRMVIPFKKRAETLGILGTVAERTRFEPGCISSRVYQGVEDEHVIMIEEFWKSREELERHLRSEEYRQVLLVVEMALEPPEIRFNTISDSAGVETIEKARGFGRKEKGS